MKTKTFILACLFLGIGFTQLSAQSIVVNTTWDYWCPIYCDGVQVDYLTGTAIAHCVFHYDANGDLVWGNYTIRGEATSDYTGEDFSIKEKKNPCQATVDTSSSASILRNCSFLL